MKKWVKVIVLVVLLILAMFIARNTANINTNNVNVDNTIKNNESKKEENDEIKEKEYSEDIEVVATLEDAITNNSAWCGTFQLVWNDMQDEVVKQDIVFQKQIELVENLNKQTFKEEDISEEYYYKTYGLKTLDLKEKIEKGIKEKFDQNSDVLDLLDWNGVPKDDSGYTTSHKEYLFYVMLYREFNFENEFEELESSTFKGTQEEYEDIKFFGLELNGNYEARKQINVLYYNSEEDFAVKLNTKEGDEVILVKGDNGATFDDIYNNVLLKENSYDELKTLFTENDTLKVPNLNIDVLKKYEELMENGDGTKLFYAADGDVCSIKNAIQTIKFTLDKTGGKIKSEAVIEMTKDSAMIMDPEEVEYRYFEFDSEFTIFLKEEGKDKPYFAANIDDITLFQE